MVGENSWLVWLTGALGWKDAFLDRILMAVILVRFYASVLGGLCVLAVPCML